jgi:hydrogenase expression/formation protein HypC
VTAGERVDLTVGQRVDVTIGQRVDLTAGQRVDVTGAELVAGPVCSSDEHCITCGDIAVEVRVVRLLPDALAVVDTGEGEETVSVALVSATVGDTILVHAGEALTVLGSPGHDTVLGPSGHDTVLGSSGHDAAAPGATR